MGWLMFYYDVHAIEPIPLTRPEATFHSVAHGVLASVVDGVETGPHGWSVSPNVSENQSLVIRCDRPVEAAELDISMYFMSGRPLSSIAEFSLSYTTDQVPSLTGNWRPLDVQRFNAEVANLRRTSNGRLTSEPMERMWTGNVRDDVYRITALLPGGRATGFRIDAFPVRDDLSLPPVLARNENSNFVLTEFRVSMHVRQTTNIALHRPVFASHPLYINKTGEAMKAESLTDGLPATIAHPKDSGLGRDFYFLIDLGKMADIDHIGLRNRGDVEPQRMSKMLVSLYLAYPEKDESPAWSGGTRADGSHPELGEVDILRSENGSGVFRGQYLRISSGNLMPLSPQLAEVEVYETRIPEIVMALADGKEIPIGKGLDLPPGVKRLSLKLRIQQEGMPPGIFFRWRVRGDLEQWQNSRLMHLDLPCPPAGVSIFEAQALHSDGQWDGMVYRLPITARLFFWETPIFRWLAGTLGVLSALGLGLFVARRRIRRQMEWLRLENALAKERSRIAQDLHDDLGAELSSIAMLADLARHDAPFKEKVSSRLGEITSLAQHTVKRLEEIVWAVNPANDSVEGFASYFCKFAQNYLELAGVASRFDLPDLFPENPLTTVKRHNLFLAAKEAIHNAVRHGAPTVVTIRMQIIDEAFHLSIEDDGCGFADSSDFTIARGSANMSQRMKAIDGIYQRNSYPSKGTIVKLSITLKSTQI